MIIILSLVFIFGICWGSFLNVLAYRLIRKESLLSRSRCIQCKKTLPWYDLIPLISWIILAGKCRYCRSSIYWIYPFIELISGLFFTTIFINIPAFYWVAYSVFFSALIVTIRTDIETLLISRYMTLALIPLGWVFSAYSLLPIGPIESLVGTLSGYLTLWLIGTGFYHLRNKEGLGEGDMELLAFIGAFLGPFGVWISLVLGAFLGTIIGLLLLMISPKKEGDILLPFGSFLALAALFYTVTEHYWFSLFHIGL